MIAPIDRPGFPGRFPLKPLNNPADEAAFTVLDGDGNESLSKDEWTKAGWTEDRFKAFDGNGDGQVSKDEFMQSRRYEREFNAKDTNKDGSLSKDEFQPKFDWAKKLGSGGVFGGGFAGTLVHKLADRFTQFDGNKDGKVSKEEYFAGRRKEEAPPVLNPIPWGPAWATGLTKKSEN